MPDGVDSPPSPWGNKKGTFFCVSPELHYLCIMKVKIDWKKAVVFLIVAGGLYFIFESFAMALGIILILFVIDYFIADKMDDRRRRKEREEE